MAPVWRNNRLIMRDTISLKKFLSIDYLLIKRNGVILNKIVSFLHLNFGHILADKCRGVFFFANQQHIAFFGNDVAIQPVDDR